LFLSCIGYQ